MLRCSNRSKQAAEAHGRVATALFQPMPMPWPPPNGSVASQTTHAHSSAMIDEPLAMAALFDGFLLEYNGPAGAAWRPDRFITVAPTLEEALTAVITYVGKQIDLHVIEQGATVLARARELGVIDGKVIGLI